MSERFILKKFKDINLNDDFFDTLKKDYIEFTEWFNKKTLNDESAFVHLNDDKVGAFIYIKDENEELELRDRTLPIKKRLKIGTLKLSEDTRGIRLGEGAIGLALWKWQEKQFDEVYITTFPNKNSIILLVEKFGFKKIGENKRGELVFIKNRNELDFSDPYKSFPFINGNFNTAGIIPVNDKFHDQLFTYSDLYGTKLEVEEVSAGNGITKNFIAAPYTNMHYEVNEPVFIYRIHTGDGKKTFKSAITSFATITNIITIKQDGNCLKSFDEYITIASNKTVFDMDELKQLYKIKKNLVIIEMVYNGYFGKGNNVNHKTLNSNKLFESYPYNIDYTKDEFISILKMGNKDVQNIIIN